MATISGSSNGYTLTLTLTQGSQSVANNTTSLSWKLVFKCTDSFYQNSSTKDTFKAVINGTTVFNTSKVISFSGSDTYITIGSGTLNIPHNSDGTKTVSASIAFTPGRSASYYPSSISKSGSMSLATIPRASVPSLVTYPDTTESVEIGSKILIHMNRKSDSFTHTVKYSWYDKSETIAEGVESNTSWVIPINFCDDVPNSTTGSGTVTVETYNGTTLVGIKTVEFKGTVPSSVVPTIEDITVSEANSAVSSLGVYVQNKTKLSIAIKSTIAYGSSIKYYKITAGSYTINASSGTTGVISESGSLKIAVNIADSRGRSATKSITVAILPYSPPIFENVKVSRGDTTCDISANGKCSSIKNGSTEKNAFRYKILYRQKWTDTWITLKEASTSVITYAFSAAITGLNESSSYEFQLYAGDYFGYSYPIPYDVSTAKVYADRDLKNGRTALNKKLEHDDSTLELLEDAVIWAGNYKDTAKNIVYKEKRKTLWSGTTGEGSTITLSDNVDNYRRLIFSVGSSPTERIDVRIDEATKSGSYSGFSISYRNNQILVRTVSFTINTDNFDLIIDAAKNISLSNGSVGTLGSFSIYRVEGVI